MRNLTAATTAALVDYAVETAIIIEIEWEPGATVTYATRHIGTQINGKILSISPIEQLLSLNKSLTSQVSFTLDDTNNEIKDILNNINIHKVVCRVYLYEVTTDINLDKVLIFKGQISAPFEWGEADRQIDFTVINQIESNEIGFSPEESQLDFVSPEFVGKAWPLVFGHREHVRTQKVKQAVVGELLETYGLVDPTIDLKISELINAYQLQATLKTFWSLAIQGAEGIARQANVLLPLLVTAIKEEDNKLIDFNLKLREVDQLKRAAKGVNPIAIAARQEFKDAEEDFDDIARELAIIALRKRSLLLECNFFRFEILLQRELARSIVSAHNEMKRLFSEIMELFKQKCLQAVLNRDCVLAEFGEDFPQNEDTHVIINNVRFRVEYTDREMCFKSGPLPVYEDVEVQQWVPDNEPCSGLSDLDGLDLFYLENNEILEGMYLLVKQSDLVDISGNVLITGGYHIIKVNRQIGNKVYFDLIEWDTSNQSGFPRGINIDAVVRGIVTITENLGGFNQPIPLGLFIGALDPLTRNLLFSTRFLQVIQQIVPAVQIDPNNPPRNFFEIENALEILFSILNRDELQCILYLTLLEPYDNLANIVLIDDPEPHEIFTIIGQHIEKVEEACGVIRPSWFAKNIPFEEIPDSLEWQADANTPIHLASSPCEIYIANILPSTIKAVHAYRTKSNGKRILAPVPSRYYTKLENHNLNTINVTALVFKQPITAIPGENWEDDIYVTLNSSVGPKVVDVIQHIVDTYLPTKTLDATSKSNVDTIIGNNGPVNFPLYEKIDAVQELQRICWESRIAMYEFNDTLFLKYLSEKGSSVATFDEDTIDSTSLKLSYSRTEDLVTALRATYKVNDLPETENREVLVRHNLSRFDYVEREEFFHTFTNKEIVEKSATFWIIRLANAWKIVKFKSPIKRFNIESYDFVTLALNDPHFFTGPNFISMIENVIFNPETGELEFEMNSAIKVGELDQYLFYWPSNQLGQEFPDKVADAGTGSQVEGTIPC